MFLNDAHATHASHKEYAGATNPTHTHTFCLLMKLGVMSVGTWAPRETGISLQEAVW